MTKDSEAVVQFILAMIIVALFFFMVGNTFKHKPIDRGEPLTYPTQINVCENNPRSAFRTC